MGLGGGGMGGGGATERTGGGYNTGGTAARPTAAMRPRVRGDGAPRGGGGGNGIFSGGGGLLGGLLGGGLGSIVGLGGDRSQMSPEDRARYEAGYISARDMIDGGGPGRSGDTFEGGLFSGLLNGLGVRPNGYRQRLQERQQGLDEKPMQPAGGVPNVVAPQPSMAPTASPRPRPRPAAPFGAAANPAMGRAPASPGNQWMLANNMANARTGAGPVPQMDPMSAMGASPRVPGAVGATIPGGVPGMSGPVGPSVASNVRPAGMPMDMSTVMPGWNSLPVAVQQKIRENMGMIGR